MCKSSGPLTKCAFCGQYVPRNAAFNHAIACQQRASQQQSKSLQQAIDDIMGKDKVSKEFEHLGLDVSRNRKAFAIDGKQISITDMHIMYFDTNGDPDARYLTFRFCEGEGAKWCITHKAFSRKATLWEEKLPPRYVTIGQLMEKNGEAPCEEGCRAILAFLKSSRDAARGVRRDNAIIEITKECMRHGSWSLVRSTQDLYDFYKENYDEPMPYDFLVWMAQSMGMDMRGMGVSHGHNSKTYALICRQLGIKP